MVHGPSFFLDLDNFSFNPLTDIKNAKRRPVDKGTGGGTRVEEVNTLSLMMGWRMGMTINDRIHVVKLISYS